MQIFSPHMPVVDVRADVASVFEEGRLLLRSQNNSAQKSILVVTPGRLFMVQRCPAPGKATPEMIAAVERIVPASPQLQVASIALTEADAVRLDPKRAIPFYGYLLGMGYIGHEVLVFEGHATSFRAGVRDASLLLVDGRMVPFLHKEWVADAYEVMQDPKILVLQPTGKLQQVVKSGGGAKGTN